MKLNMLQRAFMAGAACVTVCGELPPMSREQLAKMMVPIYTKFKEEFDNEENATMVACFHDWLTFDTAGDGAGVEAGDNSRVSDGPEDSARASDSLCGRNENAEGDSNLGMDIGAINSI